MNGGTETRRPVWDALDYTRDAIVEASAGTGKTYAIQNMVLRLVRDKGFAAPQILVVTFTEKAAGELKSRIRQALLADGLLKGDFDEMDICTIHAFCKRFIDEYAFESAMPMRSEICACPRELHRRAAVAALHDDAFRAAFADRLEAATPSDAPSIAAIVAAATKGFDEPQELKEHEEYLRSGSPEDINAAFRAMIHRQCDAIKSSEGVLTYDDLVRVAADVATGRAASGADSARARRRLLESIRRRYRVALVDEFQDTDERQWELFRTLFSHETGGLLIAVGDPKQAIYSFRGADVAVYCRARDAIAASSGAPPFTLSETYRSSRSMIDAFNIFFGEGGETGWFASGAAGEGISYSPVSFPPENPKFAGLGREDELSPIVLLEAMPDDVSPSGRSEATVHFGNKAVALPKFAESAAEEMKRLRSFRGGTAAHPLRFAYGDMCVLVGTNGEAEIVRSVLARHGIPHAQYKQKGVFASAEAEGVAALMDFLANPSSGGRRMALLLSPVFAIRPWQAARLSTEFEAKFNALAEELGDMAARREWARLFERVMNADCTALAFPDGGECAFNRRRGAVRQIFDALLADDATRRARDCRELADALRELRAADAAARENGSLYEKESAADRVQIMTMHASKGLQFPIVFVATGFGSVPKADAQERRRLLYVAITRAEHRVYLPWSRRAWQWECAVTKRGKEQTATGFGIGSKGADLAKGGFLADAIMRYRETRGFGDAENAAAAPPPGAPAAQDGRRSGGGKPRLLDLDLRALRERRLHWESFTSLQAKMEAAAAPDDGDERESHAKSLPPSLLPRSNISGNVFHEIMETLCRNDEESGDVGFANALDASCEERLMELVRRAMRRNALANREEGGDSTERTLLRLARTALSTPISIGGETFLLSGVERRDRLAEVDFVLSRSTDGSAPDADIALNGKIDLVIRRGKKAFLIDWKTNSLPSYSPEAVKAAMDDANYHLQYRLYALAAAAWLRPRGLEPCGAAYLFVRGGERGDAAGVFATEDLSMP